MTSTRFAPIRLIPACQDANPKAATTNAEYAAAAQAPALTAPQSARTRSGAANGTTARPAISVV